MPRPVGDRVEPSTSRTPRPLVTVIRSSSGWRALDMWELWRYRELVVFLAWRDVQVRYKQTALGAAWAILQPLAAMVVFTVFFGRLANLPSDGVPYSLFAYAGLLPWTYFANATTNASSSLVTNTNLITKVYFPRLVVPLASVLAPLIDFAIGFGLLVVLLLASGFMPSSAVIFLPFLVALTVISALSVSVWLSALDVQYRDVRYAIPFFMQIWLFATPVVYPASLVPEHYRGLYGLNPMAGIVEGFRWVLFARGEPPSLMLAVSALVVLILLTSGLFYFRRTEREFADII